MKRLYRSRKDKIIAGVCGGIAEYFNIDPVIIRIIAVMANSMISISRSVSGSVKSGVLIGRGPFVPAYRRYACLTNQSTNNCCGGLVCRKCNGTW